MGEDLDKRKLSKLAEETGGRSFFLKDVNELPAGIYSEIENELRSQYLIAYQSTNISGGKDFRSVELEGRAARGGSEDDPGVLPVNGPPPNPHPLAPLPTSSQHPSPGEGNAIRTCPAFLPLLPGRGVGRRSGEEGRG